MRSLFMKLSFKWLKKIKEFFSSTDSSYICPDCGEEVYFFGPGGPTHKCDPITLTRKIVLDMKQKGEI